MATDAIVVLEQLHCIKLRDLETRTEPYIWPVLIRIDDNTIATEEDVAVVTLPTQFARVVIKNSMRAGDVAPIPVTAGVLRTRFEDNLDRHVLLLVVALLEHDETPTDSMQAGFHAFSDELGEAVAENLIGLGTNNEDDLQELIDEIKKRVEERVKSAIRNSLSAYEKAKVFAGVLNLDDAHGSDHAAFGRDTLVPEPIHLFFEKKGKFLGIETLTQYEITGQLQIKPVVADRCGPQVIAVREAQQVVKDIEEEIKSLQDQLRGEGEEEGGQLPKDFIIDEIERIRREELAPAVAALQEAQRALALCRARQGVVSLPRTGGVIRAG